MGPQTVVYVRGHIVLLHICKGPQTVVYVRGHILNGKQQSEKLKGHWVGTGCDMDAVGFLDAAEELLVETTQRTADGATAHINYYFFRPPSELPTKPRPIYRRSRLPMERLLG